MGNGYFGPLGHAWGMGLAARLAMGSVSFSGSPFGIWGPKLYVCWQRYKAGKAQLARQPEDGDHELT